MLWLAVSLALPIVLVALWACVWLWKSLCGSDQPADSFMVDRSEWWQ